MCILATRWAPHLHPQSTGKTKTNCLARKKKRQSWCVGRIFPFSVYAGYQYSRQPEAPFFLNRNITDRKNKAAKCTRWHVSYLDRPMYGRGQRIGIDEVSNTATRTSIQPKGKRRRRRRRREGCLDDRCEGVLFFSRLRDWPLYARRPFRLLPG